MKNKFIIGFLIILLILIGLLFWKNSTNKDLICFENNLNKNKICIEIEIAENVNKRSTGLMFRENLENNTGMLFTYNNSGKYSFWMKNTLIPLDIIWINKDLKIVDIQEAVPCLTTNCPSYGGRILAKYVLEVNSGFAKKNNLTIGNKALIKIKNI